MFENRSYKELIVIYVFIAIIGAIILGIFHFYTWKSFFSDPIVIIVVANIEFALIFYVLFLPVKIKRDRKKAEEKKKENK